MQPIGRDRHAELPVAVEQRIADFGVLLPILVEAMERHGHLQLVPEVRTSTRR
jgi:hypothetical protein